MRPGDAAETAQRIAEFRSGCTALLLADHAPLSPADRVWLKERCRVWSRGLDETLAMLEDTSDAAGVLTATDALVRRLSQSLRDRAAVG